MTSAVNHSSCGKVRVVIYAAFITSSEWENKKQSSFLFSAQSAGSQSKTKSYRWFASVWMICNQ